MICYMIEYLVGKDSSIISNTNFFMKIDVLQEILRPNTWGALVGMDFKPDGVHTEKELFMELAKSDRAMSILLYGPPGTGKTTAIRLFAHDYLGTHFDTKFKKYNASSEVNVKIIRDDVIDFAGSEDDTDLRNIIFFDEVDGVGWQAQDNLRAVMEEYSYNCIFLMACNKINRIHTAIISRSTVFKMDKLPNEWCKDWFSKSADICKMKVEGKVIEKVLNHYDGDLRHVISDFFTKFYGKQILSWNPKPTYSEEIFNATNRIDEYCSLARKTYIEPIQLLHELFELNGKKGAKILSLACDRILGGGDVLINMIMALESLT